MPFGGSYFNTMRSNPAEEFQRDFITKTLVQQVQFEQWVKYIFYLNAKLQKEYDAVYQDAFYVKLYEMSSEGIGYATKVYNYMKKSNNLDKANLYSTLINGFEKIIADLNEPELLYIEYRRHSASHIFQNQYEFIQDNLTIKKSRKGKDLKEIDSILKNLVKKHGNDRQIDKYLNSKIQPKLTKLYMSIKK